MSDRALLALNLAEARDGLARKAFSARELAAAYNDAVAETKALNAYITPTPERALAMADAADQRIARGEARPLDGIPIAVKDLFCTKGILTTAGSHILDGFHPPYKSTVTERLWQAGAVMLGKTNLDEFAMGSSSTTSWYGAVENPWRRPGDNRPLVAGGSSGGSAAAVAARAALAATGTDTGGSIRQPASFCGIVGSEADLWPLLALGCGRLRLLARPSGADGPHRARRGADARRDGRTRPEGFDFGAGAGAGFRCGADRRHSRPARRHPSGISGRQGCREKSSLCGSKGPNGCGRRVRSRSRSACR